MSAPDKMIELSDGRTLKVYHEEDADDPRSWDNLGTMVCMHRRYTLGDKHSYNESDFTSWTDLERRIIEDHDPVVIMPLFMMDHSGLSIRAGRGFGDCDPQGWDWGQIGFIFVGRGAAAEEFGTLDGPETIEKIRRCLLAEVNVYDKFLRGDVWKGAEQRGPDSRVGDMVYPPVNGLRCLLGGVTCGVVKLDDLSAAELDAVADGLLRDIGTRPPLPAGREAAPVLCPGCSCEEHVLLAGPGRLFRCQGCGGVHGECDLPTFRKLVSGKWATLTVPHDQMQYVDVTILGDGRPRRWHGWVDRLTTNVVQEG